MALSLWQILEEVLAALVSFEHGGPASFDLSWRGKAYTVTLAPK